MSEGIPCIRFLANSSWGSPGNETEYFGPRTQRALTRFQQRYIDINSIEKFEVEIGLAKSIVLAGVIGKVEDEGHQQGTKRVFEAVARAQAYKVAGGGDTEAALTKFGLTDQFTWISVGGGAMLEYLANKTLPGIESLT
jgi:3-phosphoglycerate kinase